MQFSKIAIIFALGATASATAIERASNDCGAIALCAEPPSGKCDIKKPATCTADGGTPYCCATTGLINVLTCVNLLNNVSVDVPITIDLGAITLPL